MTKLELTYPVVGAAITTEEPAVTTALEAIRAWANGNIDEANLKAEGIPESKLAKAVQEKLGTNMTLTYAASAISLEGVNGKFYLMETAGTTLTLPTPTANRLIAVTAKSSGAAVKVTASSGKINGDFLTAGGQTTIELLQGQHVAVFADGANWWIFAGEPKREQKWEAEVARTIGTEYEPSATRPVAVSVKVLGEVNKALAAQIAIGGVEMAIQRIPTQPGNPWITFSFIVPPGQKWKVINLENSKEAASHYLTL